MIFYGPSWTRSQEYLLDQRGTYRIFLLILLHPALLCMMISIETLLKSYHS